MALSTVPAAGASLPVLEATPLFREREEEMRATVEMVHSFVHITVDFFNRFAIDCETKLQRVQRSLHRLEYHTSVLEQQLQSLSGVDVAFVPTGADVLDREDGSRSSPTLSSSPSTSSPTTTGAAVASPPQPPDEDGPQEKLALPLFSATAMDGAAPSPPPRWLANAASGVRRFCPRLRGYFELVEMGVPVEAVKERMRQDGLSSEWLDRPLAPLPNESRQSLMEPLRVEDCLRG